MKKIIFIILLIAALSISFFYTTKKLMKKNPPYKAEIEEIIEYLLNNQITYNHTTLKEMLDDFSIKADKIYLDYLQDQENYEIYYEQLNAISGTVSLYPDFICEKLKPAIIKHDNNYDPDNDCEIYIYDKYIKEFNIKNGKEYKKLIDYYNAVFIKITNYKSEMLK